MLNECVVCVQTGVQHIASLVAISTSILSPHRNVLVTTYPKREHIMNASLAVTAMLFNALTFAIQIAICVINPEFIVPTVLKLIYIYIS